MAHELPRLDACLSLYSVIWNAFGTKDFETSELLAERYEREANQDILSSDDPSQHLELLVAYGLLEQINEDVYRARCTPDETKREWQNQFADRAERLHTVAQSTREKRTTIDSSDEIDITYRGQTYVSIFVDDDVTLETVIERIDELVERDRLHAGIALRCPADQADIAQHIADDLTDPNEVTKTVSPFVFEKVNSEVKGTDSDALQFRLYVAPSN